ncbi:hypothetical protein ACHAPJ_008772 [Fusarium lateritium]
MASTGTNQAVPLDSEGKATKIVRMKVHDGIRIYHNPDNADVDIVAVPGLGAHPEQCWTGETQNGGTFNWLKDEKGLVSVSATARIMLWQNASAWVGRNRVDQDLYSLAHELLVALQDVRKSEASRRAVVFIGHSMGGLVIAKAIAIAFTHRYNEFPNLFECVTACMFFGTPFEGAMPADAMLMYAESGNQERARLYTSFLELMQKDNQALRELKDEYERLSSRSAVKIRNCCVWEQEPTDFRSLLKEVEIRVVREMGESAKGIWKIIGAKLDQENSPFVVRSSALLSPGASMQAFDLKKDHRSFVKFTGPDDMDYIKVMQRLPQMILSAVPNATKRLQASQFHVQNYKIANDVRKRLAAVEMSRYRVGLDDPIDLKRITSDKDPYSMLYDANKSRQNKIVWMRGTKGRNKTAMSASCSNRLEKVVEEAESSSHSGRPDDIMVSFFCNSDRGCHTAEDALRSILSQLIQQNESLAVFARRFVVNMNALQDDQNKEGRHSLTFDNLWQCLLEMLATDDSVKTVYFVIDSIHLMDGNQRLVESIVKDFGKGASGGDSVYWKPARTRWLVTSEPDPAIAELLKEEAETIDLDDDPDGEARKQELHQHIDRRVTQLGLELGLRRADQSRLKHQMISYAEDETWVEVVYILLGGLDAMKEADGFYLSVVQKVRKAQGKAQLAGIIKDEWEHRLEQAGDEIVRLRLHHMLSVLLVSFESPTLEETAVIVGGGETGEKIFDLVNICSPMLKIQPTDGTERIVFSNKDIKNILVKIVGVDKGCKYEEMIQSDIALNSLEHIQRCWDESDPVDSDKAEASEVHMLRYPVKFGLEHACRSGMDTANTIRQDFPRFWETESPLRHAWLSEYERHADRNSRLSNDNWTLRSLRALHVAAAIGYTQLVSCLWIHGFANQLDTPGTSKYTPLHLATYYGHNETAKHLLQTGGDINVCDSSVRSPLHIAAADANINMMKLLIDNGANVDAQARGKELVIHCAIRSGSMEAVTMILNKSPNLQVPGISHPICHAVFSKKDLFYNILKEMEGDWEQQDLDLALEKASASGRDDIMGILLDRNAVPGAAYTLPCFQSVFDKATQNSQWKALGILLEHEPQINCRAAFQTAAARANFRPVPGKRFILQVLWDKIKRQPAQQIVDKALYEATLNQRVPTVEWLLDCCRANPNSIISNSNYGTAVAAAAYFGSNEILDALIKKGATPNNKEAFPLWQGARIGNLEIVRKVIQLGEGIDRSNPRTIYGTALHVACFAGHEDVVEKLLDHGANPNIKGGNDANSSYPIIVATSKSNVGIVDALLRAKKTKNRDAVRLDVVGGRMNTTPLIYASLGMPRDSVRSLIRAGADVNQKDGHNRTALLGAASRGAVDTVQLLIDEGAHLLHVDGSKRNALQVAIGQRNIHAGHISVVRILSDRLAPILASLKTACDEGDDLANKINEALPCPPTQDGNQEDIQSGSESDNTDNFLDAEEGVESPSASEAKTGATSVSRNVKDRIGLEHHGEEREASNEDVIETASLASSQTTSRKMPELIKDKSRRVNSRIKSFAEHLGEQVGEGTKSWKEKAKNAGEKANAKRQQLVDEGKDWMEGEEGQALKSKAKGAAVAGAKLVGQVLLSEVSNKGRQRR